MFNIKCEINNSNFYNFNKKLFDKSNFIKKIKVFFEKKGHSTDLKLFKQISNKSLVILIAMICPFTINEKQVLLECRNINHLANTIVSLFDFEIIL